MLSADGDQPPSRASNWWNSKEQQVRGLTSLKTQCKTACGFSVVFYSILLQHPVSFFSCFQTLKLVFCVPNVFLTGCCLKKTLSLLFIIIVFCREDTRCVVTSLTKTGFSSIRRKGQILASHKTLLNHFSGTVSSDQTLVYVLLSAATSWRCWMCWRAGFTPSPCPST